MLCPGQDSADFDENGPSHDEDGAQNSVQAHPLLEKQKADADAKKGAHLAKGRCIAGLGLFQPQTEGDERQQHDDAPQENAFGVVFHFRDDPACLVLPKDSHRVEYQHIKGEMEGVDKDVSGHNSQFVRYGPEGVKKRGSQCA